MTPGRDALEDRLGEPPALLDLGVLPLQVDGRLLEPAAAGGQLVGHAVEGVDQRPELVGRLALDAVLEVAGADLARRRRQQLDRPRDALGEVEPHPGRAHQDHERDHQEERQVDARQRALQDAQLGVRLVGLRHAPRARRQIAGQLDARHDDADRRAVGLADDGRRADQFAAALERLPHPRVGLAGRRSGCEPIRRPPGSRPGGIDGDATSTTGTTCGSAPSGAEPRGRPRPGPPAAA